MNDQAVQEQMMAAPVRPAAEYTDLITTVNDKIIATIESCTNSQLRRVTTEEQWPVVVVAHHTGTVQQAFAEVLKAMETGAPVPQFSAEDVARNNARHARDFAGVGKPETLAFLRTSSSGLTDAIRHLPEERLVEIAGTFAGFELTVAQLLEFAVIAHLNEHLASIRATIAN